MFLNIPLIEWIGYVASVVVAVSLTMSSIIKLRWLNLAGSAVFSFYGFAIGSLPVGMLNLFIAIVNIIFLLKIYNRTETFKIILSENDDSYMMYFLEYYRQDIEKFFPGFEQNKPNLLLQAKNRISLLILRNAAVAGIFIGERKNGELQVFLDFVIPEFRDLKPADFLFRKNADLFKNMGITLISAQARSPKHINYLKRMGFAEQIKETGEKTLIKTL